MAKNISFRPTNELEAWLLGRAERSMTPASVGSRVRTELDLWRATLAAELARLDLTLPELGLLADVHNGTIQNADVIAAGGGIGPVAGDVHYVVAESPGRWGEKWGCDEPVLLGKLDALGPAADHALVDALARWWAGEYEHSRDGWRQVGIEPRPEPRA